MLRPFRHLALLFPGLLLLLAAARVGAQPAVVPLVTWTNLWRYNQTTSYDGVPWTSRTFNDTALPAGRPVFAVEAADNPFITSRTNTILTLGRTTYYFRTAFTFTNTPSGVSLTITNVIDDGAVFYLNGVELNRLYLPAAPAAISYNTLAASHESTAFEVFTVSGPLIETNLVRGTNVLAVEVHQTTTGSSDVVFGATVTATIPDPNPPPTLQMPPVPPTTGYRLASAFGNLSFTDPIALRTPPGETNRLFVVEQAGRIAVITNLAAPNRSVFLDISTRIISGGEQGLLGLAFHPGYSTNRKFYVFYTVTTTTAQGANARHDRLSQMLTRADNPHVADTNSEVILLEQYDEASNHNGGDLHFGPDGYLYVALGDEGGGNDQYANSQLINRDFFAGLLRIDVDGRPGSLVPNPHPANTNNPLRQIRYFIPADNPWVGATNFNGSPVNPAQVRSEFYAVGLRNPWRFSFDPTTGELYLGDVGQNVYEEVNLIRRGGNYGWNYREALHAGPRANPPASVVFDHPIFEYAHGSATNQGNSITGGLVYRGSRFPGLRGAYFFADYVSGNVWMLRASGTNIVPATRITGDAAIVAFGVDPRNGDLLTADQSEDTIKRLEADPNTVVGAPLPPTLAATGAFTNLTSLTDPTQPLTPNTGVIPYEINVPFWSDNARKSRWFFMATNGARIGFNAESNWFLPEGMAWVKHFDLELTNGVPSSSRRLETRILVRTSNSVYGVTYRWGGSLTNATLVPEEGLDESITVYDSDGPRTQTWRYPSRAQCLSCHTPVAGHALGFNTLQLNRAITTPQGSVHQLAAMEQAGYFTAPIANRESLRALAHPTDETASLEWRVRSYLAANCISCHQPGGFAPPSWNAHPATPTANAGLINGTLINSGGQPQRRVIVPGDPTNSMMLLRISTRGPGQMPPLVSTLVDTQGVALLSRWITNGLSTYETLAEWQTRNFGSPTAPGAGASEDPDLDGASNNDEYLAGTDPRDPASAWRVGITRIGSAPAPVIPVLANRRHELWWSESLGDGATWRQLLSPQLAPFYPATNGFLLVPDPAVTNQGRFYRARMFAP